MIKSIVFSCLLALLVFQMASAQMQGASSTECVLCVETIKEAESKLGPIANHTDADIENELLKACTIFGPLKFECVKFVAKENEKLVDGIKNDVEPKKICEDVDMCQKPTQKVHIY